MKIEDLEIIRKGGGRIQVAFLHSLDQLGVILLHTVEPTPHHTQLFTQSTYVEYRAVSCVFQNIDPPPPSPPGECFLPAQQRRGYTLAGRRGGWGVNILEDERNRIALLH